MEKKELAVILAACVFDDEEEEDELPLKRRRIWTRDWVLRREQEGFCAKLLNELRAEDPALYRNFLRMTAEQFDDLLLRVTPHIQKQNTNMRASISPSERLVLTLRFLATGDNYQSLKLLFRIPETTISRIIPNVLDAIYKELVNDYLQVIQFN